MVETNNIIVHGDSRLWIPKIHTPINAVITDPPYGMKFESNMGRTPEAKALAQAIEGDETPEEAVATFLSIMATIMPHTAPNCEFYICTAWHVLEWWLPAVKAIDPSVKLKMMLIWNKGDPGMGDLEGNWGCGYEVILYLKKGRRPAPYRRGAVIAVDKVPPAQMVHPTEKPVHLIEKFIEFSTDPGDFIVDPYSGSGSTSVAAQKLGRNSLAFDIKADYVEIGTERLTQLGLW